MIKLDCSRPENLALLATVLLAAACGAYEDEPPEPDGPPADLEALRPELERVIQRLERLDHTGLPPLGEAEPPISFQTQSDGLDDRIFVANADGGEEVPGVRTRARAQMALIVSANGRNVIFALQHNVGRANAAHIHRAPGGANGPIVIELDSRRFSIGQARLSAADIANLRAGRLYVNVHSQANPDGEVRGQLLRQNETLFTASPLSGNDEVPPVRTSGRGSLAVILDGREEQIRTDGSFDRLLAPSTVAHIHEGPLGVNGEIRFGLTIDPVGMTRGTLSGVFDMGARDLDLLDSEGFYVNVHSEEFPAGEIRGQITRK